MSEVVVIGAGVSGLVAATYLARAGAHVVVLEAGSAAGGVCANRVPVGDFAVPAGPHALHALDPRVVKELQLDRHGLRFLVRDLPLVALRPEGPPLTLARDGYDARSSIAVVSERDGDRFIVWRRTQFAFARAMRSRWWDEGDLARDADRTELRRIRVMSAVEWLEAAFESEAMRAAFAFDALGAGLPPCAAGSALPLVWSAAQEMCGLQGAVAIPAGGPSALVDCLVAVATAAGVEFRFGSEVVRLDFDGESVRGGVLASGQIVSGDAVLSALTRRRTLIDFLPPGAVGFATARQLMEPNPVGEGKIVLALNALPKAFRHPGRYIIAERLDGIIPAHAEASAGRMPRDLALEIVVLETASTPPVLLSILARPLPVAPKEDSRQFTTRLVQAVLKALEQYAPDLVAEIAGLAAVPPSAGDPVRVEHMLAPWRERIVTPVKGLFLVGAAAEPLPAVSGRAARIAAGLVLKHMKEARR